jgi:hypothetical protein
MTKSRATYESFQGGRAPRRGTGSRAPGSAESRKAGCQHAGPATLASRATAAIPTTVPVVDHLMIRSAPIITRRQQQ